MDESLFTFTELRIALIAFALWLDAPPNEDTLAVVDRFIRQMEGQP